MIAGLAAAVLAAAVATAATTWLPVGVTDTQLRIFVDRDSVRDQDGRRHARIRVGAPRSIVGKIVLVYQDEEIDCSSRQWRLVGFQAENDAGRIVRRSPPDYRPGPMLPAIDHSIGGEVVRTVCGLRHDPLPRAGEATN